MSRYDAVVIGSGQAGNPLSQKLADHGWTEPVKKEGHCLRQEAWERRMTCKDHAGNLS
jgi:pyruvate/2-oxoglutarate dehydrogenase complex dihydrolipoamide dehydrogenase (E3) component